MRKLMALTVALVAVLSACAGSTELSDPAAILSGSTTAAASAKSVHVEVGIDGKVDTGAQGGVLDLSKTTLTVDADIAAKAGMLNLKVPNLMGLSADIILLGKDAWFRASLLGTKYAHQALKDADLNKATAMIDPAALTAALSRAVADGTVSLTKKDNIQLSGVDAYHIVAILKVPDVNTADLSVLLADALKAPTCPTAAPCATPTLKPSSTRDVPIDVYVAIKDLRLVKVVGAITLGKSSLSYVLAFSKWDQPVVVNPPPADQVQASPPAG